MSIVGLAREIVNDRLRAEGAIPTQQAHGGPDGGFIRIRPSDVGLVKKNLEGEALGKVKTIPIFLEAKHSFDLEQALATLPTLNVGPVAEPAQATTPRPAPAAAGGGVDDTSGGVKNTIAAVANHIPTEVVTGYVAVTALIPTDARLAQWIAAGFFMAITPFCLWLAVATGLHAKNQPIPWASSSWPKWKMLIATFAFLAWAAVLPNSPFLSIPGYATWVGLVVVTAMAILLGLGDKYLALSTSVTAPAPALAP